jgi:Flp pilus assembly secretin CpaC
MSTMLRPVMVGLIFLLVMIPPARAVDQTIILRLGNNSILAINSAFETVIIGDPQIVDTHSQSDRSVTLEPLHIGATNLIFVDSRNMVIANVRVFVCSVVRSAFREGSDCD